MNSDNDDFVADAAGTDLPWPDVPRLVFGDGDDRRLNARPGQVLFNPREVTPYVEGYREAAQALFKHIDESPIVPVDFMLFPLAFLWRHHVELSLKQIIAVGRRVDGGEWGFPDNQHGLTKLWEEAKPYVIQCGPPDDTGETGVVANVEANIREFEAIDPTAQGFRYSLDRKQKRSLPGAPANVNLRVLHEAMIALANFLSGVTMALENDLENLTQGSQ